MVYVKHADINKEKWDGCILNALNSLIYVHSFYLDNCTNNNWDALVLNDYETIMPITFKKKYGINYLYQPAFFQQGGIFSIKKIDGEIINLFLTEIVKRFQFAEINLNYLNPLISKINIKVSQKNNFILPLNNSYTHTAQGFKKEFIKNVAKSKKYLLEYEEAKSPDVLINQYKKLYSSRFLHVKDKDYNALKINCNSLHKHHNIILRTAGIKGEIFAAIVLLKDTKRLYNVGGSITEQGRKLRANHFLYNKVIEEFSEQDLIFDFEGSDIKGIADFYQSMNPLNQKYISIKFNNLPKLIKLFKK